MEDREKALRKATLAVIGTIIGAGLFGLPALFVRVGFWPATLLFTLLTLIVLATHLLYTNVILRSRERQRLAGYAKNSLGMVGYRIAAVTYPLQIIGVNYIYLLLGGEFLAALAQRAGLGGGAVFWQVLFWLGGAVTVFIGLRAVASVEAIGTWLLMFVMLAVILLATDAAEPMSLMHARWSGFLLPFGVFLFSLSGMSVLGETVEIVGRRPRDAYLAVSTGTLLAALLSWLFAVLLAMSAGPNLGSRPSDLIAILPPAWSWIIPVLGFLAVATSYLTTSQDLKAALFLDFEFEKTTAWVLAIFLPLLILFLASRDFLGVVGFVGAVFSGVNGLLVALVALRSARPRRALWNALFIPSVAAVALAYLAGILYHFFGS